MAFVFGIGVLYSQLFKVDARDHIPLVAYGILLWGLYSKLILGAGSVYVEGASSVRSSNLPVSFYIFHSVSREFVVFLHSAIVIAFVPLIYGRAPSVQSVWAVPFGLALLLVNGVALGLWLGPMSARFRDIHVGLASLLQLFLFVTPIFWDAKTLGNDHWAIVFNPFAWAILSIRDPLLGSGLDLSIFASYVVFTAVNFVAGIVVFARSRLWISYLT